VERKQNDVLIDTPRNDMHGFSGCPNRDGWAARPDNQPGRHN